jgi:hypothetical protein
MVMSYAGAGSIAFYQGFKADKDNICLVIRPKKEEFPQLYFVKDRQISLFQGGSSEEKKRKFILSRYKSVGQDIGPSNILELVTQDVPTQEYKVFYEIFQTVLKTELQAMEKNMAGVFVMPDISMEFNDAESKFSNSYADEVCFSFYSHYWIVCDSYKKLQDLCSKDSVSYEAEVAIEKFQAALKRCDEAGNKLLNEIYRTQRYVELKGGAFVFKSGSTTLLSPRNRASKRRLLTDEEYQQYAALIPTSRATCTSTTSSSSTAAPASPEEEVRMRLRESLPKEQIRLNLTQSSSTECDVPAASCDDNQDTAGTTAPPNTPQSAKSSAEPSVEEMADVRIASLINSLGEGEVFVSDMTDVAAAGTEGVAEVSTVLSPSTSCASFADGEDESSTRTSCSSEPGTPLPEGDGIETQSQQAQEVSRKSVDLNQRYILMRSSSQIPFQKKPPKKRRCAIM